MKLIDSFDDLLIFPGVPIDVYERSDSGLLSQGHVEVCRNMGWRIPHYLAIKLEVLQDGNLMYSPKTGDDNQYVDIPRHYFKGENIVLFRPSTGEYGSIVSTDFLEGRKWDVIFTYGGD